MVGTSKLKAFILDRSTLVELNKLIDDGWMPLRECPMPAANGVSSSAATCYVLLQKIETGPVKCCEARTLNETLCDIEHRAVMEGGE